MEGLFPEILGGRLRGRRVRPPEPRPAPRSTLKGSVCQCTFMEPKWTEHKMGRATPTRNTTWGSLHTPATDEKAEAQRGRAHGPELIDVPDTLRGSLTCC